MKAAILAFASGLIGLTGCAVQQPYDGGGMVSLREKKIAASRRGSVNSALAVRERELASGSANQLAPADLFGAAARGDLQGVQGALSQGAPVDARNLNGATALMLAASSGSLPVVQTLLGAGADVNAADDAGHTPLSAAAAAGYDDVARALKAAGARGAAGAAPAQQGAPGQWWQTGGAH